jgi:hypothetical protein
LLHSISTEQQSTTATFLSAEQQQTSRQDFIRSAMTVVAGSTTAGILFRPISPARAAKYGQFGLGSPEVLDPATAQVDSSILKSDVVQSALQKVRGYKETVSSMKQALQADPQANVRKAIIKELDFANLRASLNTVNSAFDEDTQRGTDRLIRVIIQDITELETANTQKEGILRSPRRLEIMEGKLAKLDQAFSDYLAFAQN